MIRITSTSDTPEEVALALGLDPAEAIAKADDSANPPVDDAKKDENPDGVSSESGADSGAATDEESDDGSTPEDETDTTDIKADGKPEAKPDGDKPKQKTGINKRFSKLTTERDTWQREAERLHQENLALKQPKKEDAKPDVKADEEAGAGFRAAPDVDDTDPKTGQPKYATYNDFLKDLTKWSQEGIVHATTKAQKDAAKLIAEKVDEFKTNFTRESEAQSVQQREAAEWNARQDVFKAAHEDYDAVVTNNTDLMITPTILHVMRTHPKGAEFAYWLGKNPDRTGEIASMSPTNQLLAVGPIIETLGAKPATKPNANTNGNGNGSAVKKSNAPKPARVAGSNGTSKVHSSSYRTAENMSYREYKEAREAGRVK